ncbi:hypothetical protein ACA910_018498 [Epithemia clementina (nom. ined.)]
MATAKGRAKILLQGDSLTQLCWEGWGSHVANVYQRRADVISRGYGGYNTRFFLRLPVDESLTGGDVVLTTLFLGANDQALPGLDDHKHVPLEEYKANLKILIDRIRSDYKCQQIILIGPPPVHHEQRLAYQIQRYGKEGATGVLERTMETAKTYATACEEVAKEENVAFLDLYQGMLDEGGGDDFGKFFDDGLHFSAVGHDFVGKAVVNAIAKAFPHLEVHPDTRTAQFCNSASNCEALPPYAPFHDEIDATNLDKSFESMNSKKRKEPA